MIGTRCLSIPRRIPLRSYAQLVAIFFVVSVVNNKALSFDVPVPLHIIFRSGSLLASLLLGKLILRKAYPPRKYVAVLLVTVGIIICTLASSADLEKARGSKAAGLVDAESRWGGLALGVALMLVALFLSAYLGICQERLYAAHGKQPREALFYVHALSLPFFAFFAGSIAEAAESFSASPPLHPSLPIPRLWAALGGLCLAQYACIRSVYRLTAVYSALNVTLVVTLRKLLSLFVSILYFGSPFTRLHCLGAAGVFLGTALFSDLHLHLRQSFLRLRQRLLRHQIKTD